VIGKSCADREVVGSLSDFVCFIGDFVECPVICACVLRVCFVYICKI